MPCGWRARGRRGHLERSDMTEVPRARQPQGATDQRPLIKRPRGPTIEVGVALIMKKITFCLIAAALILSACGKGEWEDTVVANNTDFVIKFVFSPQGEFTLGAKESKSFASEPFQHLVRFEYSDNHDAEPPEEVKWTAGATWPARGAVWFVPQTRSFETPPGDDD